MGLIKSYGLFWKTEDVFWGVPRNSGALLGVNAKLTTDTSVDFRDQRGVYVLYADYDLVYVGQNANQELLSRFKQHRKDDLADRWNRFSWYGLRGVKGDGNLTKYNKAAHPDSGDVMNHIEAILIHTAEPRLNRQGGRFGDAVKQFLQVRDPRLGPTQQEMIRSIHERTNGD